MKFSLLTQLFFPQSNSCCLCGTWSDTGRLVCCSCLCKLEKCLLRQESVLRRRGGVLSVAAWKHEGPVRRLIHQMKYRGNREAAAFLGREMANALIRNQHETGAVDLVIPVPLHPLRERSRGYNQALLLARHVCAGSGLTLCEGALVRVKHTASQVRRTRQERMTAMEDAFAVTDASMVCGRRILLVDDVLTTGATAMACAAALYQAGAADVAVLTATRAVFAKDSTSRLT